MVYLANRRKYFRARAQTGAWADFDLSKTGAHVSSVQLQDGTATYNASTPLMCYGVIALPNGKLLLNAHSQGHAYVWGFDAGHSLELDRIDASFSSRMTAYAYFYGVFFNQDGTVLYRTSNGQYLNRHTLSGAYNLASASGATTVLSLANQGVMANPQYFEFNPAGDLLLYKADRSQYLFSLDLGTAWPTSAPMSWRITCKDLAAFNSALGGSQTWNGFTFSPDGQTAVLTTNTTVVKFTLATPWDINTLTFHSKITLYSDVRSVSGDSTVAVTLAGVAMNGTGTKMIVHNRAEGSSGKSRFFEYNLVV